MIITKVAQLTSNNIISSLIKTDDLIEGLFVYGAGIIPGTIINSILDETSIEISTNSLATATSIITFTESTPGTFLEECQAKYDTQQIMIENGKLLQFNIRSEFLITRGNMNSVKERFPQTKYYIRAYSIIFSPSVEQLERAGLREISECIFTTTLKDWEDQNLNISDIDMIRSTVIIDNETYQIKEKSKQKQKGTIFLNYSFGVSKK